MPSASAFLDTMCFMEYRPPWEIDWPGCLGCDEVELLIAPSVIRELNRLKDSNPVKRTRKRAAMAIRHLAALRKGTRELPTGSSVRFVPYEPTLDFQARRLSAEVADDWLLASIVEFRAEYPGERVMLVTADLGLEIKATAHGIETKAPPEDQRVPDEPDTGNGERRGGSVQERRPDLSLAFQSGADHEKVELQGWLPPPPYQRSERMERVRRSYQRLDENAGLLAGVYASREIARLNAERESYLNEYEEYLQRLEAYEESEARTVAVNLLLSNRGNWVAEDVDVILTLPAGLTVYSEESYHRKPKAPARPGPSMGLVTPAWLPPPVDDIFGRPTATPQPDNSTVVEFHEQRLKLNQAVSLKAFWIAFPSFEEIRSFNMQYRINAGNLSQEVEGALHLIASVIGRSEGTPE